jgi:vacuolar-type H+-ATPase subunit E/Vma4
MKLELAKKLEETESLYDFFRMKETILANVAEELKEKLEGIQSYADFYAYKAQIIRDLQGGETRKTKQKG